MSSQKLTPSKIFLWILMGLLFVGIAGFGATSFTGSVSRIGTVGDTDITVDDYARALQQDIRAIEAQFGQAITFEQARQFGVPDQVMARLVTSAALDDEAARIGLSVGDAEVARQVQEIPAFAGGDGQFDREAYRFALENAGFTEAEFEADLRAETARSLLQGAVVSGAEMPDIYYDTLVDYALESRDILFLTLEPEDLPQPPAPATPEDLRAHYEANIAAYTRPEAKALTVAYVTPEMMLAEVEVDEANLRALYADRIDQYVLPERRLVERLVFPNDAAAEAALARITAGESDFEAEVTARGLSVLDVDMGDVTEADLGAAAQAVFAADIGAVAGPAPSDFGPALFRVNATLPAQETPFEAVRDELQDELARDRAVRVIETLAEAAENELAAGGTLEELADSTAMALTTLEWTPQSEGGLSGYQAFREAALSVTQDDFPSILSLVDGGAFALRLDDVLPAAPYPFAEVEAEVRADLDSQRLLDALAAEGEALAARVAEGVTPAAVLGNEAQALAGVTRDDFLSALPEGSVTQIFAMQPGQARALRGADMVAVVALTGITPADRDSEDARAYARLLRDSARSDLAQDLFRALAVDVQGRAGLTIDQAAVNAVHANFQ